MAMLRVASAVSGLLSDPYAAGRTSTFKFLSDPMKKIKAFLFMVFMALSFQTMAQQPPKGTSWVVKEGEGVKVHTYMSPVQMFANTSHVIELKDQLIVVDGQFFAPYAFELKALTDKLGKPISRFYISHDHPDHYIGFGDAFPTVPVYALEETMASIKKDGLEVLSARQKRFGALISKSLNMPAFVQKPGQERIAGVDFIFEKSVDNEAAVSLVIKIPSIGVYVAQDIIYNQVHLFISGDTRGWKDAIRKIQSENQYSVILSGHGKEGGPVLLDENLAYLDFVDDALKTTKSKEEYKAKILARYPNHGGVQLIDIYLAAYLKNDNWK
jgi:hypothetical protein